jgi:hypothetical protein
VGHPSARNTVAELLLTWIPSMGKIDHCSTPDCRLLSKPWESRYGENKRGFGQLPSHRGTSKRTQKAGRSNGAFQQGTERATIRPTPRQGPKVAHTSSPGRDLKARPSPVGRLKITRDAVTGRFTPSPNSKQTEDCRPGLLSARALQIS